MSRTANVLLALAVVFLTSAIVVYYTPVAKGEVAPDARPLVAVGSILILLMYGVDSHLIRRFVPFLRPAAVETQRQIGTVVHEGQKLLGRLNTYAANEGDTAAKEYWETQVQRWTDWADTIIHWRVPHLRSNFANEADRDPAPYVGTSWQHNSASWMQVRMKRLNEYVLYADRLHDELGPRPSDDMRNVPEWPEPPEPQGGLAYGSVSR